VGGVQEGGRDGEKGELQTGGQEGLATHADTTKVGGIADDEERSDFGVRGEPAGQGDNLRESAETARLDVLDAALAGLKQDKVVAVLRGQVLGEFQKVQRRGQGHLGEAPDFKAAHTEQESWGEPFAKELKGVVFAAHVAGEDKNEVRRAWVIGRGEPGVQPGQQRARPIESLGRGFH